jgi:hypothetical protein
MTKCTTIQQLLFLTGSNATTMSALSIIPSEDDFCTTIRALLGKTIRSTSTVVLVADQIKANWLTLATEKNLGSRTITAYLISFSSHSSERYSTCITRAPTIGTGLGETQRTRIDEHAKPLPTMKPGNHSNQSAAHRRCNQVHPFPLRISLGGRLLFYAVNKVDGTGQYSAYVTKL